MNFAEAVEKVKLELKKAFPYTDIVQRKTDKYGFTDIDIVGLRQDHFEQYIHVSCALTREYGIKNNLFINSEPEKGLTP